MRTNSSHKKKSQQEINQFIFAKLHSGTWGKGQEHKLSTDSSEIELNDKRLEEIVRGHYYLAVSNLKQAQILLAVLCVVVLTAIAAVRSTSAMEALFFCLLLGIIVGLPFLLIRFAMSKARTLPIFRLLAVGSFGYFMFISLVLVVLAPILQITGVILIPLLVTTAYLVELIKLQTLIHNLAKLS